MTATLTDERPAWPTCPQCDGKIHIFMATGVVDDDAFYEKPEVVQRKRVSVRCENGHVFKIEDGPSGRWHVYETK